MRGAVAALAALIVSCASSALAAPGDRDSSFGRDGLVHSDLGGTDFPAALTVQPDGHIAVGGYADVKPPSDGRLGFGQLDFALARYTPSGRLDRTFGGGDGRVTADLGGEDMVAALARQPDGKLVLAGHSKAIAAPVYEIAVARFRANGRLDPAFGAGTGFVTLTVGDPRWVIVGLIHVLADGRIVLVGRTASGDGTGNLVFARLLPDGRPDEAFAAGGVRVVEFGGPGSFPTPFLLDSEGGVIVAGSGPAPQLDAPRPAVVQRFSLDGELDRSFGVGGTTTLGSHERGPAALALQGDDIVVAINSGPYGFEGQLVRLSPTGVVDTSFGSGGVASTISPSSLAVDGAGSLILGGEFPGVVRYDRDGSLDRGFRNRKPRYSYSHDHGTDVAVDPGQRILGVELHLAGSDPDDFSPPAYDFGVVRLHGGDDVSAPVIALRARPRGCVSKGFRLRLHLGDDAGPAHAVVRLDGRHLLTTKRARTTVRVRARRLRPGRHSISVRARDGSDNVAVRRLGFRRCR